MTHPRIFARLLNTMLMVHPGKAAAILAGLGGRITGTAIDLDSAETVAHVAFGTGRPSLGTVGDRLGRAYERRGQIPYDMVGNVAVIPIEGSLVHKGAFVESDSGETSYQGIQTQVARAMKDPAVKGVAFEVDSYGGEVSGAFETSDMIAKLSRIKPTIAILSDHAYSCGYLMASAARQIVVPEQGGAGSIGVITMHTDMSAALERSGLKVTILSAGAHKADANPFEPLPDDVANSIRAELEGARAMFAGRVAQYRGARLTFENAMATEARCFTGAEAVRAGLADATGHPSEVFSAFISTLNRA
jgi:signal peptide peptidase SppA